MKLSYKIFGSFLLTIILSLFLMVAILRIHAAISFSDFINDRLMEKMGDLKEKLIVEYNRNNSWEFLRSKPHQFRSLVERSIDKKDRFGQKPGLFHERPRPMAPEHGFDHRPNPQGPDDFPEPRHRKNGRMPPPMMGPQDLIDRISLFDENKNPVAGLSKNHSKNTLGDITVNGKIIGYLGIDKDRQLFEPRETGFLKQQFKAFTFIGCGVLFLSALVSFVLSKHMLSPIKGLIKSTQDVASFKFNTRIDIKTNDELGRLAQDFNSMAMTLEKYEDLRKQWISDISHELRTPLSVLQAEVEALEDGVRELNHEALSSLHGEISHLTKIVNDLHDLSLSDSGMLYFRMEPVNPVEILVETLQLFKTTCEKQNITLVQHLKIDPCSMIAGDRDRLVQMFSNIIENGIKYMTKPGQLTIRQKVFHNRLVLSFEDSGPGVPEESLGRLFDRFYRLDSSRSRKKGGSGLGLSICRNIAETMGGIISARNTNQGGLGIDIDLPLDARGNKPQ